MKIIKINAAQINATATCIFTDGRNFVIMMKERWGMETMTYTMNEMVEVYGQDSTNFVCAAFDVLAPAE